MTLSSRSYKRALIASGLVGGILLLALAFSPWANSVLSPQHDHIRDLQQLPIGNVAHLQGVVTFADHSGKRFWIQDNTGAIAIDQDPQQYGLRGGETVNINGKKTHAYIPYSGPSSVDLTDLKISLNRTHLELLPPAIASFRSLPEKEKIGIRVQLVGVVHQIARDSLGHDQITLGESGREIPARIANNKVDLSKLINARVRVVGVSESIYDENGRPQDRHLWIQSSDDVRLQEPAPKDSPLYSIRSLYHDFKKTAEHRIRLRGVVGSALNANSLMLEDKWGAVACDFDAPTTLAPGSTVEITGFPVADGLRVDVLHSVAKAIPSQQLEDSQNEQLPTLTSVSVVHGLDEKQAAEALPVKLTGVVTYNDPDWGQLFFHDSTGGIYVKYPGSTALLQGQKVTIIGITNPGDYAPIVIAPKFIVSGRASLPRPIQVNATAASSGILDSQFVEVKGVVHPLKNEESMHLTFELYSPFGQIHVYTNPTFIGKDQLANLVDATVQAQGVFGTIFNSRRQLVGYQLSISSIKDIRVLAPADQDPFQKVITPINHLLRYSPHADSSHRIKVKGSVTMLGRGFFYLQDDTGGVEVQGDTHSIHLSDEVEAVGYASAGGGYSPVLIDSAVHVVGHNAPVAATKVTAESSSMGQFDSQLVTLEGRLISVLDSSNGKSLILQAGARTFRAQLDSLDTTQPLPELTSGSVLRLTGICSLQVNPRKIYLILAQEPIAFNIVLRSPADVQILQPAPWWTAQHALSVLGISFLTILVTFVWVTLLRRRVHSQMIALQKATEKAKAVHDLTGAMQKVTLKKDFSGKVSVGGDDEIVQLGIEFNKMLAELKSRDAAKKRAEEKLQYQALTDELTGLPNRRLLSDRLTQTLALAKRREKIVAVLYIDLDGFKLVNDSLGHMVGDMLLGQVSERLQSRIRQSDTLARLGGDEFTVVLTTLECKEDAGRVATNLLEALSKPFFLESHEVVISASIGISLYPENGADGIELLQQADSAMYTAKRNGKNQLCYYTSELGSLVRERLSLENQLRGAMSRGEIAVHYQPEFDVLSGRLIRFEALARWTHPTLGVIPPSKFIPIAEESGLIIPFGAYIMERACAEAVSWQGQSPEPIQVAVNVSSIQFMRETFVHEVSEILRHTGLKPNLLQIELTESVMLHGAEKAAEVMRQLGALGVSMAIDDFGTGYSCFSYLPKLPFNALKIDRSFVKELEYRPETKAMVQSLVTLAHNLDMQVIVEGVETPEQLAMIKQFGGNEAQGYLLGKPTADPSSQLTRWRESLGQLQPAVKSKA
ncbi:MAG TPA: EAL domain-containing protein [Terriglobales bacterium]